LLNEHFYAGSCESPASSVAANVFAIIFHELAMVVSLKKSDADAAEQPFVSRASMARPTVVADQPLAERVATGRADDAVADAQPDRALRHRIILGNVIAWLVILVIIRLIFF
jgi:hypothetical protein